MILNQTVWIHERSTLEVSALPWRATKMSLIGYLLTAHELFQSETPAKRGGVGDSNAGYPYNTLVRIVRRCIWEIILPSVGVSFALICKWLKLGFASA